MRYVASRLAAVVLLASVLTFAGGRPARADDGGAWVWTELRLTLYPGGADFPRTQLRVWTDTRFMESAEGLQQQFLRVGPLVHVLPWMFVAAHGTVYADRLPGGRFDQEVRAELEPNLHGRLGSFTFNDRNRLEYRWRESDTRFRYRNQLRVNYAPPGAKLIPFLWDEILIDLSGEGFNQNRATVGLGWAVTEQIRIEGGYMLRSRDAGPTWAHDHIGVLYLYIER